ncbi:MAG: RidA family protein [Sulfurospirillaceae bacterium]|nr:RidA family protein [Sulfurospirillaceae bacterium]
MNQPIPQGKYQPAIRHQDIVYTSGMTSRVQGVLMYTGKIQISKPIETYFQAVRLAAKNALLAAQAVLHEYEKISMILQLSVYLNAEQGFNEHSKIADFASAFLMEELGISIVGSRIAIGVATLPSNAPVEISLVASISRS